MACIDTDFCLRKVLCLGVFPGTVPHDIIGGPNMLYLAEPEIGQSDVLADHATIMHSLF